MIINISATSITYMRMPSKPYDILIFVHKFINEPILNTRETVRTDVETVGGQFAILVNVCILPRAVMRYANTIANDAWHVVMCEDEYLLIGVGFHKLL